VALSVTIEMGSPIPVYEQLRSQVTAHVVAGLLRPGDQLPPVRELATDLGVAVGTVNRAYRELELDGTVTTQRRTGTIVTSTPLSPRPSTKLLRQIETVIRTARDSNLGDEQILELVRASLLQIE
jgi:GntR family transcriptional regulator